MRVAAETPFHLVLIKPSHYDNDGYPIRFLRSFVPSNSLAAVYGLAEDARERRALGPDVDICITAHDETNTRIRPDRIIAELRRKGGKALIGLVGVQSNQYPRALDLARPFRAAGLPVMIGGFHVSGCLAMLPELPREIQEAVDLGISLFAGEAEDHRLDEVLRDARDGTLKPIYNHMNDLPVLTGEPVPDLPAETVKLVKGAYASFDLGRGCPFQCSFCTIINVQGRKSRFRSPDDLERIVRQNAARGIFGFFITDDNFARNRDWEVLLDRLIKLRTDEGLKVHLIIQVDTLCHRIPNFIEKAAKAGVRRVFIGLENINPDNLAAAKKKQNRITEYRLMLQKWREHNVSTYAGYILGFPNDTRESILRDVEIIKRELPLDFLEFFMLTPLPGSEDHKTQLGKIWMDPDLNKYNLHNRVTHHPVMSDAEWDGVNREAWRSYYSFEHLETLLKRRAALPKGRARQLTKRWVEFYSIMLIEDLHPLEGGVLRMRSRTERRPSLPLEPRWRFYPRLAVENARKLMGYWRLYRTAMAICRRVESDPKKASYMDLALTPPAAEDLESLSLFTDTSGGARAVAKSRRDEALRAETRRLIAAE